MATYGFINQVLVSDIAVDINCNLSIDGGLDVSEERPRLT